MKEFMKSQLNVVILRNDHKPKGVVPDAPCVYNRGVTGTLMLAYASVMPNMRTFRLQRIL